MSARARGARRVSLCVALLGACGGEAPEGDPAANGSFIALDRDFQGFRAWTRYAIGSEPLEGHAEGPRFVYANRPVPEAGGSYPVGTILVKTVEVDEDPTRWEIFAMVKRGGTFNAAGATGWEYFRLRFADATAVVIAGRGLSPTDNGARIYGPAGTGCNLCHGATVRGSDHVLSPPLVPGAR